MCTNKASISGGAVCYNETSAGSKAVYVCNGGLVLMGNKTRVCQRDGHWNGSIPQCIPEEGGMCQSQLYQLHNFMKTSYTNNKNAMV